MTTQPATVSVTRPVGLAIDRMKRVLFQPFDPGKWLVIGFCAWLAALGRGGGGGGGQYHFGPSGRGAELRRSIEQARGYVMSNLH